ncbi:MAG: Fructokinase [Tenericutes bacterium ADurb.Bin087]|nr:MAG: Fructokinase [Tenericutes bacterium ADurb.Bin087]
MLTKVIGLDIGASTMKAAVVDKDGTIYFSKEVATPEKSEFRFTQDINDLLETALFHAPEAIAIGIGVPGIVAPDSTLIHLLPNLGYENIDFTKILRKGITQPVYLLNDANCAAYAEALCGAGADYQVVQYITLSTGVGGGLVINKEVYTGGRGFAQEIGNMMIDAEAPRPNPSMNANSFEACCSGKSLFNHAKRFGTNIHNVASVFMESRFTPIRNVWVENLGKAIANIYTLYDPDVVILGGGVMKSADKFFDDILPAVKKYTFTQLHPHINLKRAAFNETGGMIGAALYALHKHTKTISKDVINLDTKDETTE